MASSKVTCDTLAGGRNSIGTGRGGVAASAQSCLQPWEHDAGGSLKCSVAFELDSAPNAATFRSVPTLLLLSETLQQPLWSLSSPGLVLFFLPKENSVSWTHLGFPETRSLETPEEPAVKDTEACRHWPADFAQREPDALSSAHA